MRRRDLSKMLLASTAGATVLASQAKAQSCTPPCYPVTSAEASVTVVDPQFPPGNVKRYGAVGDGVANDRNAIQAAINCSDEILLPPGVYKVNSGLIMRSRTRIIGANRANSILRAGASGITILSISGSHNTIEIRDLQIDGANIAAVGFSSSSPSQGSSSGMVLQSCSVARCTDRNIYIQNMTYGVLRDVYSSNSDYALLLENSYNMEVQDCLLYDCTEACLAFIACSHVTAVGTTAFTNPTISAPRLVLINRSINCGLVRCTLEAQGTAVVTAELDIDTTALPSCTSTFVDDCSFIGAAASKSRCVRIGVNSTVYKSTFRGCRFIKPQGAESVWAQLQQHTLFDDCQDLTSYAQTAFTAATVLNSSPYPVHIVQPR